MARNRLRGLAPRVFLRLTRLTVLDISNNAIQELDPEVMRDVPALRELRCAACSLTRVKSLVYRSLPRLELLDLRDNHLASLAPDEFMDLLGLRRLLLDGNRIYELKDYTFQGLALQHLGLARNRMTRMSRMAFEDSSVLALDLSSNRLPHSALRHLGPVLGHMHGLNVAGTRLTAEHLQELLRRAPRLKRLNLSRLHLKQLPPDLFSVQTRLEALNLSSNSLQYIHVDVLHALPSLHTLDLGNNEFRGLPEIILRRLDRLTEVVLDGNPWSCDQCHIPYLKMWLNASAAFRTACRPDVDAPRCLKCQSPPEMYDKPVLEVDGLELQPCPEGTFDLAAASAGGGFSVVLAAVVAAVAAALLAVIVVAGLVMYHRHSAFYYTHEDDSRHHFYENPALRSDHTDVTLDEDLDHVPDRCSRGEDGAAKGEPKPPPPPPPPAHATDNNVVVIDELMRSKAPKPTHNGKS
ncbi:Carboxypeptidase N subunit 2 [Portunus trituberculatus]|uniref:Carboxypeptidase N subunit 2 n=1 Tax=Portunus trituberculatus TaxID=210409 RepID=A0A5B7H292_PORTR|nr:Carboxypeptidase N subunit 2 [Portunus trituberculatus]